MNDDVKITLIVAAAIVAVIALIAGGLFFSAVGEDTAKLECVKAGQTALDCQSLFDGVRR
jgi:hypothetical protein